MTFAVMQQKKKMSHKLAIVTGDNVGPLMIKKD
jgi:hypothetical protein